MNRTQLIKLLRKQGCVLVRHGSDHDWYTNPGTGVAQAVPRHREINEYLARHIIKTLRSEPDDESDPKRS
jgi:hypothetical protein